jgi:ketosteroid isomerase-like protein
MTQATAADAVAIAKRYFSAVNETRLDDLAQVFAPEAVLYFPVQKPLRGREAIRDFYAAVLASYAKRYDEVRQWFTSEQGNVAAYIHFEGRTQTGNEVIFDAVDVFTIADGIIQQLNIFYDSIHVQKMALGSPK